MSAGAVKPRIGAASGSGGGAQTRPAGAPAAGSDPVRQPTPAK
jgi:hypothetical protein